MESLSSHIDVAEALAGVMAKLDRVNELLDVLKTEVQTFLDSGPYFTVGAYDPATHAWEQRVRIAEPPPPRLGVIVGEYVHDVRSALDHLVWQLILLDGGTPTRGLDR